MQSTINCSRQIYLKALTELLEEQSSTITLADREVLRGAISLIEQASDEEFAVAEAAVDMNYNLPIGWAENVASWQSCLCAEPTRALPQA